MYLVCCKIRRIVLQSVIKINNVADKKVNQEKLRRDLLQSDKDIEKVRSDLARNYPKKRHHGKSYARKKRKLENLKVERKWKEKEWIRKVLLEKGEDYIPDHTYKKWYKNFVLSVMCGEQALSTLVTDLIENKKINTKALKECVE